MGTLVRDELIAYLTHYTSKLPQYRNLSMICSANQLTGFYMMATSAFSDFITMIKIGPNIGYSYHPISYEM